jgi:hypothetical protein
MAPEPEAQRGDSPKPRVPGRGWFVWVFVAVAILADVGTTLLVDIGCAIAENPSQENLDFCASRASELAIAGIPLAVAGAVVARVVRSDWPWVVGVVAALAFAMLVWMLHP